MLYDDPDLYDALLPASQSQLNFYVTLALRHPDAVLALGGGSGQIIVPVAAKGVPRPGSIGLRQCCRLHAVVRLLPARRWNSSRETCGSSTWDGSFR